MGSISPSSRTGHHRQLPRLIGGPFRYKTYAAEYVKEAMKMATKPLKQAVIVPSKKGTEN